MQAKPTVSLPISEKRAITDLNFAFVAEQFIAPPDKNTRKRQLACLLYTSFSVTSCLLSYGCEFLALVVFFGFDQSAGSAINKDKIIAWAGSRLPFADNDTTGRRGVELFDVLDNISRGFQFLIDNETRFFLGTHPNRQPFLMPQINMPAS